MVVVVDGGRHKVYVIVIQCQYIVKKKKKNIPRARDADASRALFVIVGHYGAVCGGHGHCRWQWHVVVDVWLLLFKLYGDGVPYICVVVG
jgi:hypothetical protein